MSGAKLKQKKILWVEDERDLIDVYKYTLKEAGDYAVEFIRLGQSAIDRIKQIEDGGAEKPDLIMLDILLPDISGDLVLEEIRKSPATNDIKVIVLTNYSGEQMQEKIKDQLLADRYLVKTEWGPSKLIPFLKKLLK